MNESSEKDHEPSILSSIQTPSTHREETLDMNGEPCSSLKCKSVSVYFGDSDTSIKREDINATLLQGDAHQLAPSDQPSYEVHVLKAASEITISKRMIFEDHPKLDLSCIHSSSKDDWSCDLESTDDSNLDNGMEKSEFLDEKMSSLLSSISRVQPPLDLNHNYLHNNSPDSTLRVYSIAL